jgi:hypothetical protein
VAMADRRRGGVGCPGGHDDQPRPRAGGRPCERRDGYRAGRRGERVGGERALTRSPSAPAAFAPI